MMKNYSSLHNIKLLEINPCSIYNHYYNGIRIIIENWISISIVVQKFQIQMLEIMTVILTIIIRPVIP